MRGRTVDLEQERIRRLSPEQKGERRHEMRKARLLRFRQEQCELEAKAIPEIATRVESGVATKICSARIDHILEAFLAELTAAGLLRLSPDANATGAS